MSVCPHCQLAISRWSLASHTPVCIENPDFAERVRAGLRAASPHGVILSIRRYEREIAGRDGMPSRSHLYLKIGNWDAVAAWAGLQPASCRAEALWQYTRGLIVGLAYEYHEGEWGPSADEWDYRCPVDGLTVEELLRRFRTWSNVLAWAGGFAEADASYYKQREQERALYRIQQRLERKQRMQRMVEVEEKLLEADKKMAEVLVAGESKVVTLYDHRTHSYRECVVTQLR